MKIDIILAGVGGQGILSIAAIIGAAAIEKGLYLKQAETHGMSQRGGAVVSNLRIADYPIASDLIPLGSADIILSVEPMESLRYLPWLSKTGWLVTNSTTYENIPDYPAYSAIEQEINKLPFSVLLDADKIAKDLGNPRGSNMVILGAASKVFLFTDKEIESAIETIFKRRGADVVGLNIKAYYAGKAEAKALEVVGS